MRLLLTLLLSIALAVCEINQQDVQIAEPDGQIERRDSGDSDQQSEETEDNKNDQIHQGDLGTTSEDSNQSEDSINGKPRLMSKYQDFEKKKWQHFHPVTPPRPANMLGCGVISFRVNTNHSNTWQAIPDPNIPAYAQNGYVNLQDRENDELLMDLSGMEDYGNDDHPEEYDARDEYPFCPTIQESIDQGCHCRASWAVSAASALSDRVCIATNGEFYESLSAQRVLSCCSYCAHGRGCEGGDSLHAWVYFHDKGTVTGGEYSEGTGCSPYLLKPCQAEYRRLRKIVETPKCNYHCQQPSEQQIESESEWEIYKTKNVYTAKNTNVRTIKHEILKNGPITADIRVYEDFHCYYTGVYNHVVGDFQGFASVKIIGWGKDYWIAANTWGPTWGENGFYKFHKGNDDSIVDFTISGGKYEVRLEQ